MIALRPVMQKDNRYVNRKLLDLCHGAPCVLNFPGCTGGTSPDNPSVPAHSNWQSDGRGFARKTHDYATVPACPQCHFQLDSGPYTREQKEETFRNGQRRWWAYLWSQSLIKGITYMTPSLVRHQALAPVSSRGACDGARASTSESVCAKGRGL